MNVFAAIHEIHAGDFHRFDHGEYFSRFPYQMGIVSIYYVWAMIFGYKSEIGLQFLNVLALVYFYKKFADICVHTELNEKYPKALYMLGILFYPLVMYCSFIYGNILGLAFSVAAIDHELVFFKGGRKWHAVFSAILIFLGIMAKKNYVIFAIAMLIYAIFEILQTKKVTQLLYVLLIVIVVLTNSAFLDALTYGITGKKDSAGMTSWSYVAMGLMDGPRAYGWHNNFEEYSYEKSEHDPERQKEMALETVKGELGHFYHDTNYAKAFFILKLASEWNNPTFECHWINQICDHDGIHSELVETINSDGASGVFYGYLDGLMLMILVGALSAFWLKDSKEYSNCDLIMATIFVGGFLFHIVWEAKGQYVLSYFVLLFPYAIIGLKTLVKRITDIFGSILSGTRPEINVKKLVVFAVCVVVIIIGIGGDFRQLTEDTQRWELYLDGIVAHALMRNC